MCAVIEATDKMPEKVRIILRWCVLIAIIAVATGTSVAMFLYMLDRVTQVRWQNEWLLYLLPLAGIGIYWLYRKAGAPAAGGNDTILRVVS